MKIAKENGDFSEKSSHVTLYAFVVATGILVALGILFCWYRDWL